MENGAETQDNVEREKMQQTAKKSDSFDHSIGRLKTRNKRKVKKGHNKSFVSQQLCALERINRNSVAILAKVRQSNTQLEKDNCRFKAQQISFMMENASTERLLKPLMEENQELKKKIEVKTNILKYALSLRDQFDNVVDAIDSKQNTESSYFPMKFQIPGFGNDSNSHRNQESEILNCNAPEQNRRNTFSSGVTQRPRRVPKQKGDQDINSIQENETDENSIQENETDDNKIPKNGNIIGVENENFVDETPFNCGVSKDDTSTSNRIAILPVEKEVFQSLENDEFESPSVNGAKEKASLLDLNISTVSELDLSSQFGRPSSLNLNLSASSQSLNGSSSHDLSHNSGNKSPGCDELNNDSDVTNSLGNVSGIDLENILANEFAQTNTSVANGGNANGLTGETSSNIRPMQDCTNRDNIHQSPTKHNLTKELEDNELAKNKTKQKQIEVCEVTKRQTKLSKRGKPKAKTTKDILDKSSFDFLSCSSDSFIVDETKRINLQERHFTSDENPCAAGRTVRRRAAGAVSYAEPSLRTKMRRGDKFSDDTLFKPHTPKKIIKRKQHNKGSQNKIR